MPWSDEFMKQYSVEHELRHKRGYDIYAQTLKAYALDLNDTMLHRDLNECECLSCGDFHKAHDRISKQQFLKR